MLFERLSSRFQFARIQEHGHQLIAALADLATNILELEVVPKVVEGVLPGSGMQIDGIDQRAVDVEDHRFGHKSGSQKAEGKRERRNYLSVASNASGCCTGGNTISPDGLAGVSRQARNAARMSCSPMCQRRFKMAPEKS